jgi:hypothetical protein
MEKQNSDKELVAVRSWPSGVLDMLAKNFLFWQRTEQTAAQNGRNGNPTVPSRRLAEPGIAWHSLAPSFT